MSINYDRPLLCAVCKSEVQVELPIWVTPGEDSIDVGEVQYTATPLNTFCPTCEKHGIETLPQDEREGKLIIHTKDGDTFVLDRYLVDDPEDHLTDVQEEFEPSYLEEVAKHLHNVRGDQIADIQVRT